MPVHRLDDGGIEKAQEEILFLNSKQSFIKVLIPQNLKVKKNSLAGLVITFFGIQMFSNVYVLCSEISQLKPEG